MTRERRTNPMPQPTPPRLALALLRLGRHRGRRAEIEADLGDLFERRAAARGLPYARRRYWQDVASFYRPGFPSAPHQPARLLTGAGRMTAFSFDLRQALRGLRRQPLMFLVAALTLGIGFAAHLTSFSVIDRLLLSPPAHVHHAERVFSLHVDRFDPRTGARFVWWQTPWKAYQDLRTHATGFSAMAAYRTGRTSAGLGADARLMTVTYADEHYFPLLGVSTQRGRVFGAEDNQPPAANPVVVISDAWWRAAFGADENAIGRTMQIGSRTFTIIGVAPPGFTGDTPEPVDAWAPLHAGVHDLPSSWQTSTLLRSVNMLVRLDTGVEQAAAAERVALTYRRISAGTPAADETARIHLGSLLPGRSTDGGYTTEARIALWLHGVSLLVLLVAIANVVNLQMTRVAQQRRDLAIRIALGAGRARVLSILALEVFMTAALGTAVGIGLAWWGALVIQRLLMPDVPPAIDPTRFALAAAIALVGATVLVAGLASLQVSMHDVSDRLKTGRGGEGFTRARLRHALLIAQVMVSALLLVGAGLFVRSIARLGQLQFGIDPDRVLAVTLPLRGAGFTNQDAEAFYERALVELSSMPGVASVAASHTTPFAPSQSAEVFLPGGIRVPREHYPTYYTVTPSFFDTMGMRILRGRGFTGGDRIGAPPVIIVEAALAAALWPGQEALGKCLALGGPQQPCREVVGVSNNTRRFVRTHTGALRYYVPMGQRVLTIPPQAMLIRAAGDPVALIAPVRQALQRTAGNLPYAEIRVLREMAEPETRPWRLGSTLFVVFGAAALCVATAGVYALLSFLVTQRTREIGVRLALGASPARTLRMIVGQSLGWASAGIVAGLAAALAAGRFIKPLLFETSPYDASVLAGTAAVLLLVAAAASLTPALRASRVDPNVTLKAD
jgi:predicted permease